MSDKPTNSLTAALAAVQTRLPMVGKTETATVQTKQGGSYKYSYADLADVSKAILPLLGEYGLAWITKPTFNDAGKFVLAYTLRHVSGESESGEYPLPSSGTAQEIGSAITYARRYTLCAVTGVAPEADDDDGAAASHHPPDREQWEQAEKPPTPEQIAEFDSLTAEIAAVMRREDIGLIGGRVRHAQAEGFITASQYRALTVKAKERITVLQQAEVA